MSVNLVQWRSVCIRSDNFRQLIHCRLPGRPAGPGVVGGDNQVGDIESQKGMVWRWWLFAKRIHAGSGNNPFAQASSQIELIDNSPAGCIDQQSVRLHGLHDFAIDQPTAFFRKRAVDTQHVSRANEFIK